MTAARSAGPPQGGVESNCRGEAVGPVFAARIDLLYRLARPLLSLPFTALLFAVALYAGRISPVWATVVLGGQIAAVLAMERLLTAYARRPAGDCPIVWAHRYAFVSGAAGASWGLGALLSFLPHLFPAEAFLALAFLGMTAAEFLTRSLYRPAYIAHAVLSLGPLVIMLIREGGPYALVTSAVVAMFGAVLCVYGESVARIFDSGVRLQHENGILVSRLALEKQDAEVARDLAKTNVHAKESFIANISHELRTPLTALLGMAQLLEEGEGDRGRKGYFRVLMEAGRGLRTLLDDLTALSYYGSQAESGEDCDAAQAARTVVRLLQPHAWEKRLRLFLVAPADLPRAAADPRRVRQVLLKLTDNAVKFTQQGSIEIAVSTVSQDGRESIRFEVVDSGIGVPPEIAAHLFEPFPAGDRSYAKRHPGAGLGLAVAKQVVLSMGGRIGVQSEPGEGTRAWFTVPTRHCGQPETGEQDLAVGDVPVLSELSILLWVGGEDVRKQISRLLEPGENTLVVCESAADAIARAARSAFDVIIADESNADIIAAAPGVRAPVLAIGVEEVRTDTLARRFLRWPVNAVTLLAAINGLVAGERAAAGNAALGGHGTDDAPKPATFDATAFSVLEKSLGLSTLVAILHSYMETVEGLCASLEEAAKTENWDEASRIAQDIAGAAGGLGLAALTDAARSLAQKAREGDRLGAFRAAQSVTGEHRAARSALANLYPELAA